MIVTMNKDNSDKYLKIFTEAYEYLKELDNGYVDINKERFSSLAEYYSHMADFFDNQKYKYVMLPLDEDTFDIDLNTRTINIPTSFSKCASVQTDQLAETIIFVTDRYFDFMDLANVEIYVQWTIPEDKKNGIAEYNGATRVEMIDLESLPGKLKFAWPLNEKVTEHAGIVKFSVRFLRVDESNKVLYSLNTTDASLVIKPALQTNLHNEATLESPISDGSFKMAVLNSVYTNEGVIPPVMPEFFAPGSNITATSDIIEVNNVKIIRLENDTVTLYVQAFVADGGDISYKWYYQADDGEYYDCENYPVFDNSGNIIDYTTFGTVGLEYIAIDPQPVERVGNERYYTVENGIGSLYTGDIPAVETLYELYSTYTVPANNNNITGNYQARAWNTVPANGYAHVGKITEEKFNDGVYYTKHNNQYVMAQEWDADTIYHAKEGRNITTPYPRYSDACLLPGPTKIAFKVDGNLNKGTILTYDETLEKNKATLSVDLVVDPYQPEIKYEWRKSTVNEDEVFDIETEPFAVTNEPTIDVHDTAWYSVRANSSLNRKQAYEFSANSCKVTEKPQPPVVVTQDTALVSVKKDPVTFTIEADVRNPHGYHKALLTDNVENGEITSFEYVWQILLPDSSDFVTIKDSQKGVSGLHTKSLTVNNKLGESSASFRCLVVNHLNGARAVFDHSGTYVSDGTLGTFENKYPHIYENTDENSFVFYVTTY